MSRHHLIARLGNNEAAALFRGLADQLDKSGNGVRILAWRRFAIIFESSKQQSISPSPSSAVSPTLRDDKYIGSQRDAQNHHPVVTDAKWL